LHFVKYFFIFRLTDFFHKPLAESWRDPFSCMETTIHEDGLLILTTFSQLGKKNNKKIRSWTK